MVRVPLTAGDHALRISFPALADLDDPRTHINRDRRRKIFVDYLDVLGPFEPSTAPPASYTRIFICRHAPGKHEAQCARRMVENLARRAYRRPPTEQEIAAAIEAGRAGTEARRSVRGGHPRGFAGHSGVAEFPVPHRARPAAAVQARIA